MSSFRRLAKDHASLRGSLPPNYLFPLSDDSNTLPDDLTQLSIHLTGSEGTPYDSGLWLLHLRIPQDYPRSPPKATFKTRIFHPNVEETTGAVCLETLKRDWDPKLTLKDILVTISCLLIQPNPDSALNEKAGVLVREDYDGFMRQARLMTKIHAPIPTTLRRAVDEARQRGQEVDRKNELRKVSNKSSSSASLCRSSEGNTEEGEIDTGSNTGADLAKENDPLCRKIGTQGNTVEQKKSILGKRPLAEAVLPAQGEGNIGLLSTRMSIQAEDGERPRKSPKHTYQSHASGQGPAVVVQDANHDFLDTSKLHDNKPSISLSMTSSQPKSAKGPAPTKYRGYARIGIKRL